jgi:hypothetical protein
MRAARSVAKRTQSAGSQTYHTRVCVSFDASFRYLPRARERGRDPGVASSTRVARVVDFKTIQAERRWLFASPYRFESFFDARRFSSIGATRQWSQHGDGNRSVCVSFIGPFIIVFGSLVDAV